jgi:glycerophosphoryl diester phosphodiesterase
MPVSHAAGAKPAPGPDLVDTLRPGFVISHRGGSLVHPEHSRAGYRASAEAGYLPEQDIRALGDGVLVCSHDATVDRTMMKRDGTAVTGNVSSFSLAEWKSLRLKPLIRGARPHVPVTWQETLDELGGRIALVAEIKACTPAVTAKVIDSVVSRGLQRAVILQCFDWATCVRSASAGIATMFLSDTVGQDGGRTIEEVRAAGVELVGMSTYAAEADVRTLVEAGFKVVCWTVNDRPSADDRFAWGAVAVFSDDPWRIRRDYEPGYRERFDTGELGPIGLVNQARTVLSLDVAAGGLRVSQTAAGGGQPAFALGRLGYGPAILRARFTAQAGTSVERTRAEQLDSWIFGLYVGEKDGAGPMTEAPDEKFVLFLQRRGGGKTIYTKERGAAPAAATPSIEATAGYIGTAAAAPPWAGGPDLEYEVEVTATTARLTCVTLAENAGDGADDHTLVVDHGQDWCGATEVFLSFRFLGGDVVIRDVRLTR